MTKDLFNVPNTISLIRLALIPLFVWLIVVDAYGWAGLLFAFIGATDWIDGYLARRLGQVTEIGKMLDPLADRLAVAVAVIGGLVTGVLPAWFAWAIIVREVLIALGALYGWTHGVRRLDVRWIGKVATFALYAAVAGFYIGEGLGRVPWTTFAWILGLPGLILYYVVGVRYAVDMMQAVRATVDDDARVSQEDG
ncbi:MAG: CDP-alcohol phosphatidyltransferase family protein [Acidimicrobiia bacterium]|nr:CDP-alcohol phosphatidyltransferase family protein [Acidimicrobiia bacterium]